VSFWDRRYDSPDYVYGTEPNRFLVSQQHRLKPGMRALAVADGEGRNGVWLAQQGLDVLAVDGSPVAIEKARRLAQARRVSLRFEVADLLAWTWPRAEFDLVVAIFIHFRPRDRARMHAAMAQAVKPGGLLIMECFTTTQLEYGTGGPPLREMLYTAEMLRADFHGMKILELEETVTELHEGLYHRGPAAVVRLVARRPDARPDREAA
jgi:SAM-dependent methyltransferase